MASVVRTSVTPPPAAKAVDGHAGRDLVLLGSQFAQVTVSDAPEQPIRDALHCLVLQSCRSTPMQCSGAIGGGGCAGYCCTGCYTAMFSVCQEDVLCSVDGISII
jgi:hypothetical protein